MRFLWERSCRASGAGAFDGRGCIAVAWLRGVGGDSGFLVVAASDREGTGAP